MYDNESETKRNETFGNGAHVTNERTTVVSSLHYNI